MNEPLSALDKTEVLHELEVHSKRFRLRRKLRIVLTTVWVVVVFGLLGLQILGILKPFGLWTHFINFALVALGASSLAHRNAIRKALGNFDKRVVPYLLEAQTLPDFATTARDALPPLLLTLTEEDQGLLDPYQRHLLYTQLTTFSVQSTDLFSSDKTRSEFAEAVLFAIRQTGGSEAIAYVEDFERGARKRGGAWSRVANLALLALSDLRMRTAKRIIDKKIEEVQAAWEPESTTIRKTRDERETGVRTEQSQA